MEWNNKSNLKLLTILVTTILIVVGMVGCGRDDDPADKDVSVPSGDPPFTQLKDLWVIDNVGVMDEEAKARCSKLCQRLKDAGVAEMVVLIQNGVKHPADYSTHYGRWLRLGRNGLSSQGGNNGVVWLIRPDANEKMTYSIGRGLPRLTSGYMVDIMNKAKEYINFNNYDRGVSIIIEETSNVLFKLYGK